MKEENNFNKWYKRKIENPDVNPPEKVWDNIQDELDIENVWNNVHNELDVEDVWENIQTELNKEKKVVFLQRASYALAAAAAILLLLLAVFPPQVTKVESYGSIQLSDHYQLNNNDQINLTEIKVTDENSQQADEQFSNAMINRFEQKVTARNYHANTSAGISERDIEEDMKTIESMTTLLSSHSVNYGIAEKNYTVSDFKNPEETEDPEKQKAKFYAGASGQFANSWLLSNKTIYSIRQSPYSSAKPQQNNSFSVLAGISFNEKFDLQVEAQASNNNGQIYKEYANGSLITNQIQLNYSSLKLTGRYRFIEQSDKLPVSHHVVLGTYASYLQNAFQRIDQEKENIQNHYKNYDLGLIVGYEIDSHLSERVVFSTGFRFDPGIINIYSGSEELPAVFNKTYTTSLSLQLSLKYQLY